MNRERLKAVIAEIEADRSRYDQNTYTQGLISQHESWNRHGEYIPSKIKEFEGQIINCGTTGCIAGLASFKYAPVETKFWHGELELPGETGTPSYHQYGREVLGLSFDEADYLFSAHRSWEEIVDFSEMSDEDLANEAYYD